MTEPAPVENGTPTVTLAGKQWPIPLLAVRQLRVIREPLIAFNSRIVANAKNGQVDSFVSLSSEEYDRFLIQPVYVALTRAHKDMKLDEFLDMPITDGELVAAWFVVRNQSGIFVKVSEKEGGGADAPAGEALPNTPNGTGTE